MSKKNYLSTHNKDNLPSMKLLSTDRSAGSNYHHIAISRTSLCAGIRALTLWNSLTTHKAHSAALPAIFAEQKRTQILGCWCCWFRFGFFCLFAFKCFYILEDLCNLNRHGIKKKGKKAFFFSSNRNENFKQERLTALTNKRDSYQKHSRNSLRRRISISSPFAEAVEKVGISTGCWFLKLRHAHNLNLYHCFWV